MVTGELLTKVEAVPFSDRGEAWSTRTVPCLLRGLEYPTHAKYDLHNGRGELVAWAGRAPRLLQFQMLTEACRSGSSLKSVQDQEWLTIFAECGRSFTTNAGSCAEMVAATSGLPVVRVLKAYGAIATDLSRIGEILSAQTPSRDQNAILSHSPLARNWILIPRGRHVAVKIPGNFPTISINWLISLAARRPVLLCASLQDPFTVYRLAQCLYQAGMPGNAIALCYDQADCFWQNCDQVLFSGESPDWACRNPARVKSYHHGRSKVLLAGVELDRSHAMRLALLATQGCGRLCTNVSAVLTDGREQTAATALASAMTSFSVLPLRDPQAFVPCFPDRKVALSIADRISAAIARGARDISRDLTGDPLLVELPDGLFLRPTVLLVDVEDPIFGTEFPFPFVTVARSHASEFVARCRHSLIVSVIGGTRSLIDELIFEPTIDKVFHGEDFDHAYDPVDPHEGYLVDFLFQKKAVSPDGY
jgi:acyl-CoA reductase-like NAD-dependent aldehyde dehydrogenase